MSKSKAHCWTFGHSVFAPKASTQVPTQVICQIIKERPRPHWAEAGGRKYSPGPYSVNNTIPRLPHPEPLAAPGSRAAQYSDRITLVNAVQHRHQRRL
jgi:hypothetical protein